MKYLLFLFLLMSSTILAFGQVAPQTEKVGPITQASQANQEIWKKQQESLINDSEKKLRQLDDQAEGSLPLPGVGYLPEPKISKVQKNLITPSADDLTKYAEFLKLPKTGIFKILSSPDCGNKLIVDVKNEKCLNNPNLDLSYYSFRKRLYAALPWSDLSYQDKYLSVGVERLTIGLIREIGEVVPESLNKESAEVKALIELKMPKEQPQIKATKDVIKEGTEIGGSKFLDKVESKPGQTYLLRSYSYRTGMDALNDRRIDIVVAFKIVEVKENGVLTIIWKELYKGNTHKI